MDPRGQTEAAWVRRCGLAVSLPCQGGSEEAPVAAAEWGEGTWEEVRSAAACRPGK